MTREATDDYDWVLIDNPEVTLRGEISPCRHMKDLGGNRYNVPHALRVWSADRGSFVTICLDCVLAQIAAKKEKKKKD